MEKLRDLYFNLVNCEACSVRKGCTQVVRADGSLNPILMIIGEAPGAEEDEQGIPFVGACGQILRDVVRGTKIINKTNTLITNVLKCRPPKNKFPKDETPSICVGKWLTQEIAIAKPQRILLLGAVPLKFVAGMKGITSVRGQWINIQGIRGMATFHPSYVMRQDSAGDMQTRQLFESDIMETAKEVLEIETKRNA